MNRMSALFPGEKSSTAAGEGCEGKARKSQVIGRHGYRRTSTADASSQLFAANRYPSYRACKTISGRQGASSSLTVRRAKVKAASAQSFVADMHSLHKTCEKVSGSRGASSSVTAPHAAEGSHTVAVKSTSVSSSQQSVRMSTEKDKSEQQSRPGTWKPDSQQVASAIAPSDTRSADSIRQAPGLSVLPPVLLPEQLLEKGYQLAGLKPFACGSVQSVYSLRKAVNDSEILEFVVKFPVEGKRPRALRGVNIQEQLANLKGGEQYFVPVVEKVMENDELICHVEPEGTPATWFIRDTKLDLKQKLQIFSHILEAVERMHANNVVNLDIKLGNIIMEKPDAAMKARFCDFDASTKLKDTDRRFTLPITTCENMCCEVLQKVRYLPVMADLWAAALTLWKLITSDTPSMHWLSGVLSSSRQDEIMLGLVEIFPFLACDPVPEEGLPSDGECMTPCKRLRRLRNYVFRSKNVEARKKMQLFFWNNLEFPDDIYKLRLLPDERCILEEILSIMFLPSSYSDKFRRMMSLMTTASRCAGQFARCTECNEEGILQIIQKAGYQPCVRIERPARAIQPMQSLQSPQSPQSPQFMQSMQATRSLQSLHAMHAMHTMRSLQATRSLQAVQSRQPYPSSDQLSGGCDEEISRAEVSAHIGDEQNRQVNDLWPGNLQWFEL